MEQNWAGTYAYGAARILTPTSIDELQEAVRGDGPVRALGTRHSFHDLPDTTGTLVTAIGIPADPVLDESARTVTVGAGTRYGELAGWLEERGWALHNLGSLPHISIGGATQTGTHGSGDGNGVLSTAVRALDYIGADGARHRVAQGEPDFDALVVGLGAFGIVVRITLAIEPSYRVRQDVYRGLTWDAALGSLREITSAAYSVSLFTRWTGDEFGPLWVKHRLEHDDDPVFETLLDATRDPRSGTSLDGKPGAIEDNVTEQGGVPGPWNARLPHFRFDAKPSAGEEIQTEYFVDPAHAAAALTELRPLADRIEPLLHWSEFRTASADDLWLSGAYQRPLFAIHFTWKDEKDGVDALLPEIERRLADFAPRPHWGKYNLLSADAIAAASPRLADARAVFDRLDPAGRFSNVHLESRGLRSAR